MGVEVLPLDLGLQLVLLVRQQVNFDEGVGGAGEVLCRELLAPEYFDGEGRVLKAVAYAELDPAQLLTDRPFTVIILRAWRQLQDHKCSQININTHAAAAATNTKSSVQGHTLSLTQARAQRP